MAIKGWLPRNSAWLVLSLFVQGVSDVVAQFLPMKAIFIVAGDRVPSFFPRSLIEAGPTAASFALLAGALAATLITSALRRLNETLSSLDKPVEVNPHQSPGFASFLARKGLKPNDFAASLEVVFFTAVSLWVAPLIPLVVFVGLSSIVLWRSLQGRQIVSARVNKTAWVLERLRQATSGISIWLVAGAAMFNAIVAPPPMGITGLLVGAILMRRAIQFAPNLLLGIFAERERDYILSKHGNRVPRLSILPIDYVFRTYHDFGLENDFGRNNLSWESWAVVGVPSQQQVSVLVENYDLDETVLIRLFATDACSMLENELRYYGQVLGETAPGVVSQSETLGYPSLVLRGNWSVESATKSLISQAGAVRWQVEQELNSIQWAQSELPIVKKAGTEFIGRLFEKLHESSEAGGQNLNSAAQLLESKEESLKLYLSGPAIAHFGSPVASTHLFATRSGAPFLSDVSAWRWGFLGESWGAADNYLDAAKLVNGERRLADMGEQVLTAAQFRRDLVFLSRGLERRSPRDVEFWVRSALKSLNKF